MLIDVKHIQKRGVAGRRYRRAARYLWDSGPELKVDKITVEEDPRFVN